jgi:hypothetical protein
MSISGRVLRAGLAGDAATVHLLTERYTPTGTPQVVLYCLKEVSTLDGKKIHGTKFIASLKSKKYGNDKRQGSKYVNGTWLRYGGIM